MTPFIQVKESKFIETGSGRVVARGWGAGATGRRCSIGTEFQFWKMERIWEMDTGDGCTRL